MVSRENKLIVGFGSVALVLMYAIVLFTSLPQWVSITVLFVIGIIIPQILNNHLDRTRDGSQ